MYLLISISVVWLEREYFDYLDENLNCAAPNRTNFNLKEECSCAYLNPKDSKRHVIIKSIKLFYLINFLRFELF